MRIGIVGLDTSHVVAFTRLLNDEADPYHVPGGRVVAAYSGGSDAFSKSRDRVAGFTEELVTTYGLKLCDTIEALAEDVDAILLESNDGRQHLEQFGRLAKGKPVYIDKPLATTTADAGAILALAEETNTPVMSCSSLRYAAGIRDLVEDRARVVSCEAFGPAPLLDDYPGLFWYGIHAAEMLFAFMGSGCERVRCLAYPDQDVVVGEWKDGRIGVLRGTRYESGSFGCVVHTQQGTAVGLAASEPPYYSLLLDEVMAFFESGVSPIAQRETLEIVAFLEAADRSRAQDQRMIGIAV
jgi:predicted dehydrogenase